MDRHVAGLHRGLLGVLALAAVLLLVHPSPARAQSICGNSKCRAIICYGPDNFCQTIWIGCYTAYPWLGVCLCPSPGTGACIPTIEALTGDGGPPTEQQLLDEGFDVCHELVRERMKTDRQVVLFDKETAAAVLTGPDSVGVSGFAHPRAAVIANDPRGPLDLDPVINPEEEPVGRRFDCEVQRGDNGRWTVQALTLAEDQK